MTEHETDRAEAAAIRAASEAAHGGVSSAETWRRAKAAHRAALATRVDPCIYCGRPARPSEIDCAACSGEVAVGPSRAPEHDGD